MDVLKYLTKHGVNGLLFFTHTYHVFSELWSW